MANLSAETLCEMLSIIRKARNDMKKLREYDKAKTRPKEDLSIESTRPFWFNRQRPRLHGVTILMIIQSKLTLCSSKSKPMNR